MADDVARAPRRRSRRLRTRLLGGGFAAAVVIAVFVFFLPRIADYRSVWDVVQELSWVDLAILAAATVLNIRPSRLRGWRHCRVSASGRRWH